MSERFWAKVHKTESCWIWTGARNWRGYGLFKILGKYKGAHRVVWELERGEIPAGLMVLHECDNPSCVNPNHLHLGTAEDNARERVQRRRRVKREDQAPRPIHSKNSNRSQLVKKRAFREEHVQWMRISLTTKLY